jgi:hypothetical protein
MKKRKLGKSKAEQLDSRAVDWMEKVSDEQYRR